MATTSTTPVAYLTEHLFKPFGETVSAFAAFKKQYPQDFAELKEQAEREIAMDKAA